MLYKIELPIFLNSEGAAENLSATAGSSDKFRVDFSPPLKVPRDAIQPTIALIGFDSFYTYPNLTSAAQLRFTATGSSTFGAASGVAQTVSFPKGLYAVSALQGVISDFLVASTLPDTLLTISGNDATQKVSFVASGLAAGATLVGGVIGGLLAIPIAMALRTVLFRYVWIRRKAPEKVVQMEAL